MTRSRLAIAVIARPSLAAAGVCAPAATVAVLAGSRAWVVLAVAAWATLVGFVFAAPRLWPGTAEAVARVTLVTAWAGSMIALVAGLFGHYAVAIDHALCGDGRGATATAATAAAVVYLAGSVWALRTGRRAVWAWPLLTLVGWAVHLVLLFLFPGAHGFCET